MAEAYGVPVEKVEESERFVRHAMFCGGQYVMRKLGNSLTNDQYLMCPGGTERNRNGDNQ